MSPRGPGSRILGIVTGFPAKVSRASTRFLARASRALASLDPGAWVIRHRRADIYVPAALFVMGAVALALSAAPATSIAIGLPPLAFIMLVMIRAYRANVARRHAVMSEIDGARYLVRQCVGHLKLLSSHWPGLSGLSESQRARLVLGRLSSGTKLLVTRYRRYLDEGAVEAAMEAERLVLGAEIAQGGKIDDYVPAIKHQLDIVSGGIRDINDRLVSYELGRV